MVEYFKTSPTTPTSILTVRFDSDGLDHLVRLLLSDGYEVVGPTVRDGAIMLGTLGNAGELPEGVGDVQSEGRYRLTERRDRARFGYAVGPDSWKRFVFPPRRLLWRAIPEERGFAVELPALDPKRRAFLGVRGCEIAALHIQDRVFAGGSFADPDYVSTRNHTLLVAVECGSPADTCFCTSMGTGPEISSGFDIRLTEIVDLDSVHYLATAHTQVGAEIIQRLETTATTATDLENRRAVLASASEHIRRRLDPDYAREAVLKHPDHEHWATIADRCLACGNCTQVCPTCFCSTVEDATSLIDRTAERVRRWDSCFTLDHSLVHGGALHRSTRSRYRQWLTHKLGTWQEQFGTPGCSGCGRCIAWCPVGIDLTCEVKKFESPAMAASKETK